MASLDFTPERLVSGETHTFPGKMNSMQKKMEFYAQQRNTKDDEINQKAVAAGQSEEEARGYALAAKDYRNAGQTAANQAEQNAAKAEYSWQQVEAASGIVQEAKESAAEIKVVSAEVVKANETAVEQAQLLLDATSRLSVSTTEIQQVTNEAAEQAAATTREGLQSYLDQAKEIAETAGKSAYQIWEQQEANNGKSEEEFISSLSLGLPELVRIDNMFGIMHQTTREVLDSFKEMKIELAATREVLATTADAASFKLTEWFHMNLNAGSIHKNARGI